MKNSLTGYCAAIICTSSSFLFTINHAHAASISDLLITEVMANPAAVSDGNGEWFELYNPGTNAIKLSGIVLSDDGSNQHTISSANDLFISAGDYFVLGRNGDSSQNGGIELDYVYSSFTLGNSSDQIILTDSIGNELRLEYESGFSSSGNSTELIALGTYGFTDSNQIFGDGDIGTPGFAGSYLPAVSAVPLPASAWLFVSGLLGLMGFSRRQ